MWRQAGDLRVVVALLALVMCSALVMWRLVDSLADRARVGAPARWKSLVGAGSALAVGVSGPLVPAPSITVPVSDVIAPAVAVSILRRILQVRRIQVMNHVGSEQPRTLTADEMETLARVVRASRSISRYAHAPEIDESAQSPEIRQLLSAVQDCDPGPAVGHSVNTHDWKLIVRLIGEPVVENRSGERAVFGKKKSIELLSWIVLNRDRSTRSAARTALWDVDVASSTFSTIISDLRRGMRRLNIDSGDVDLSPSTYTDELPLSSSVITDVEILQHALSSASLDDLVAALKLVRDMPFAGTSYLWADLDGSTTRIVMTIMKAVWLAIELAGDAGDDEAVITAVRAGLRVMPGDEELLAVQKSQLSTWKP